MEIIELLLILVQGCGCFLDVAAVGSTVGTGVAGARARRNYRNRKVRDRSDHPPRLSPTGAAAPDEPPPPAGPRKVNVALIVFLILLPVSVLLTALAVMKWLRP